ncbi:MAG: phosphoribosylaminoimidazolesuccinocarboxamide synthase, partial [Nanoarchaeota archaeon]
EEGKREICGIGLPNSLLRYQKLGEPIFTPATKAESGHDENISFEAVENKLGEEIAEKVKDVSIKLYKRGAEVALQKGLLFIDTKYEFGLDENGNLYLIDEANTPDSSRYCTAEEYKKFRLIEIEMWTGRYKNVSELLKLKPELKIEELSKQFVRDVIIEKGFGYGGTGEIPKLEDEDVVEISYRYIRLYEMLTGNTFEFPDGNVKSDLIFKLRNTGYINGCLVVIIAGSDSDMLHIEAIKNELDFYDIKSEIRICSAHKQPTKCEEIVKKYNQSLEPIVFVCVAGGTDALSGVVSFHSVYPVVSCPPNNEEHLSCISNPPGSSNSLILKPANVAKHIAQIFGQNNAELQKKLIEVSKNKIDKLELADSKMIEDNKKV